MKSFNKCWYYIDFTYIIVKVLIKQVLNYELKQFKGKILIIVQYFITYIFVYF